MISFWEPGNWEKIFLFPLNFPAKTEKNTHTVDIATIVYFDNVHDMMTGKICTYLYGHIISKYFGRYELIISVNMKTMIFSKIWQDTPILSLKPAPS